MSRYIIRAPDGRESERGDVLDAKDVAREYGVGATVHMATEGGEVLLSSEVKWTAITRELSLRRAS